MQHEFRHDGETYDVLLERTPKIWTFANHCAHPREDGRIRIYFEDGTKAWAHVAKVGDVWWVHHSGRIFTMERIEAGASSDEHLGGLVAPMPGVVLDVFVSAGESVEAGQTLMILEAMKTKNPVPNPIDGTIKEICVEDGQPVEFGQTIATLD